MGRTAVHVRFAALGALVIVAGLLPGAAPAVAAPPDSPSEPRASKPEHRGTINVRELAKQARAERPTGRSEAPFLTRSGAAPGGVAAPASITAATDPVEVTETANPPLVQPQAWEGLTSADTGFEPPDPWVGVGPEHVVQVVNTSIRIWDRLGTPKLTAELGIARFFNVPPGDENADPRVMYDALHGRWIATEFTRTCDLDLNGVDNDPGGLLDFLVSRTADPLGTWDLWAFEYPELMPDYPAAGWSSDKLGFTANVFDFSGCTTGDFLGSDVIFVDWADLLDGNEVLASDGYALGDEFTPRIATQFPATSQFLHVVSQDSSFSPVYRRITGSVAADTWNFSGQFDLAGANVLAPFVDPPFPQQPGPDVVTERIDSRITDAIWKDNRLTFVSSNACTPTGDTIERSCVRVSQLNTASVSAATPPSRTQDFLIAENGADHYYGGVGQSGDGTLHVVWTRSSTSAGNFPSSLHAYQPTGDPANSLSERAVLAAGTAAYQGDRWGDYTGVAQDPQVPNAIWQGNQYSTGANWATRISQLQTTGSTYVPITPIRVLDTRTSASIGLTGRFNANVPRSWTVAGFDSGAIPLDAVAVTGNVTVVNQTAKGFVSVTVGQNANPTSSTVNFPAGDTRANNVTVPLAQDGRLSAVYKATAGNNTNLIFDVTGYFLAGSDDATYNTLTPFRRFDSRTGTGMPGAVRTPFATGVPRTFSIAGADGIPADAVAITGNVTVVGQTTRGFVGITPDPVPSPETSNLNFPVGDTRANGFTAPLNASGDLSVVYVGSAGATAHVLMDVTGYYLDDASGLVFYPLNPGRIFDTRTTVLSGLSGRFNKRVPRQLLTHGHWGVAEDAGAITGNLTVTGQTERGYIGMTLASTPIPQTSTLNFPLGDTRANGITVPLNGGGGTWLSYVDVDAGADTTNLLLDVTGYFAP